MTDNGNRARRFGTLHSWLGALLFFLMVLAVGYVLPGFFRAEPKSLAEAILQDKKIPAPELDGGVAWLNTEKPIKLKDLRGRVVLLDFWTLCCINCIHTLPDLAKLEAKYAGVLVVIGVHSPKFPHEKKTSAIRKAILRYEIAHPVVNDANMAIWRRYGRFGVNGWPTLVLIDPDGNYYGTASGEGNFEVLDHHIGKLVKKYQALGKLKKKPLEFQLARRTEPPQKYPLYFPGKVLADAKGNRLFIADSTHHRIVITDLAGKWIATAGSGREGLKDGSFSEAQFSDPQGMTLVGDILYVADRKNHCVRAVNLKKRTVERVAGTGEQNYFRGFGGEAKKTGLNSPWDLLHHKGKIFIAMAGSHQIWYLDLKRNIVAPYAGSGREDLVDGPLGDSAFAQPSGLATDGKYLYVADSEISAIRKLPLDGKGHVETIVGEGLFVFGDRDGKGKEVRLQHALGVAYRDGVLYVADTYNSKIKVIDPKERTCRTMKLERADNEKGPLLNEPGGLSFAGDSLYVADTSAHRIRVIDMRTRSIRTLALQGVRPPAPAEKAKPGSK